MKVLITEPEFYSDKFLENCPNNWEIIKLDITSNKHFVQELKKVNYEIIFVKIGLAINNKVINSQPNLKMIVTPTTGLDHIDTDFAEKKKIKLISLKDDSKFLSSITSTAEHAWMLSLALQRKLLKSIQIVKDGKWERKNLSIYQLKDKTLGIIGFGRLGKMISLYGKVFKMNIIVHEIKKIKNRNINLVSLENLISNSDLIILVAGYKKDQNPIITTHQLSLAKKRPIIINVSRGRLVDEKAIIASLEKNQISGYAADVVSDDSNWDNQTITDNNLIEKFKNDERIIITPHVGGYSIDAIYSTREYILKKTINNIN